MICAQIGVRVKEVSKLFVTAHVQKYERITLSEQSYERNTLSEQSYVIPLWQTNGAKLVIFQFDWQDPGSGI